MRTDRSHKMRSGRFIIYMISTMLLFSEMAFAAQPPRKIKVEKLSSPKELLMEVGQDELLRKLIVDNIDTLQYIERYNPKILAHSELPASMVNFGYTSLFSGMFEAYANHRPFAVSPDMIWLLICQGFSNHVTINSEALRDKFVDFEGQKDLVVTVDGRYKEVNWEELIADFSSMVEDNCSGNIAKLLESDFSTTTPAERVASQATILNSMKNYFRYTAVMIGCGIPEIDLYGTEEDWQEIIRRTKELAKYDLEWWTSEMLPVLEMIKRSAAGDVDKVFWRNMIKYHTKEVYGNPKYVDGWIVKFYPYLRDDKRSDLKEVARGDIRDQVVRVPIKLVDEENGKIYDLELCAGFFGLEQNPENYMLTPKIGWYLYEVESVDKIEVDKHYDNLEINADKVKELPASLFNIKSIDTLTIEAQHFKLEKANNDTTEVVKTGYGFLNIIEIPQKLGDVKIKKLYLTGNVYDNNSKPLTTTEIKEWFNEYVPNCEVIMKSK